MKKRFLHTLVAVAALILLFSFSASAKSEYAYKYSGKAYDASIKYLNEFYLEKHPDFALKNSYGAPNDWKYLENELKSIIKGCKTDLEKAAAIISWVNENIDYSSESFSFPKDVYVSKKGDCLGDSYLIQQFMRMCDIPAVVCVGWRGDLVGTVDKDFIDNADYPRHAWVEAYIDGKWRLYDILFDVYAETSRKFITKWYFFESIEGVAPYYSKNAIKWHFGGTGCFYRNGRFYCYENGKPGSDAWLFWDDIYHQMRCLGYAENSGFSYLDPARKSPAKNEAFTNGFLQIYGWGYEDFYAQCNGILPTATIQKINGKYYFFDQSGKAMYLTNHIDEYYMINSAIYMADGEKLPLYMPYKEGGYSKGLKVKYESIDPDKVSIDSDGTVRLKKGCDKADTIIDIRLLNESGGQMNSFGFNVIVLSNKSKHSEDNDYHTYKTVSCTPATAKKAGKMVKQCTGCSKKLSYTIPAIKSVKLERKTMSYTGEKVYPPVTVKDTKGNELIYGVDYTISLKNNKDLGKGTLTVKFKGKYSGTVSKSFEIGLRAPSKIKVSKREATLLRFYWYPIEGATEYRVYVYDEKKGKYVFVKSLTDDTVYESDGYKSATTYKFRVVALCKKDGKTYKSKYTYLTVTTRPVRVKTEKLTSTKAGTVTLAWNGVSRADGYQIKYSTSKEFTDKTTKSVTVEGKNKLTLKKLKSGKKYYVAVRAYKVVNGKRLYGAYSSVRSIKVR